MYSLSTEASEDLDAILDYSILNFGLDVMIDYHSTLEDCFKSIEENPKLGINIEYIQKDYLYFKHRSHLIFYKINEKGILIVRILHKSMDVSRHFNRD